MEIKKARKLRDSMIIIGLIIMLLAYLWEPLSVIGAIVAFSSLISHFLFNKCPYCRKNLGRDTGDFCQYCGKNIGE